MYVCTPGSAGDHLSHLSSQTMDTTAVWALHGAVFHTQASQRQLCLEGSDDSCVRALPLFLELFSTLLSASPHLVLWSS